MRCNLIQGELYCLKFPNYRDSNNRLTDFIVYTEGKPTKYYAEESRPTKKVANGDPLLFLGSVFSTLGRENFLFLFDESVILVEGFNHDYLELFE